MGATVAGVALGLLAQAVGVVLVGFGVALVRGVHGPADRRGVARSALVIGATIAGYTLVDNEGIEHASTLAYLELVLAPVALATLRGPTCGRWGARSPSQPRIGRRCSQASSLSAHTHSPSLRSRSPPRRPLAAVRETSILFAVGLGAMLLRERVSVARAAGAALVVAGVTLVALA